MYNICLCSLKQQYVLVSEDDGKRWQGTSGKGDGRGPKEKRTGPLASPFISQTPHVARPLF